MQQVDLNSIINKLLDDITANILAIIFRETGLDKKSTMVNTLTVEQIEKGVLIEMKGYARYLDKGRAPGARKIPFTPILNWIRNKRIKVAGKSDRQLAFMIINSIYKKGIRPRNFISKIISSTSKLMADRTEQELAIILNSNLKDYFFIQ